MTTLLHLCAPADWRSALSSGAVAPPSLEEVGFVHLSTPEQVELPANRLFAGRRDMVLLAVDTDLLDGVEIRWEPGVPGDPESMRFPHAYGAIPARAVRAVLPYRPDGEGRFATPVVPELDDAGRARLFEPSLLRRVATREIEVTGGIAVITDPVPSSRAHNQLILDRPVDARAIVAECDRVLGGAGLMHASALTPATGRPTAEELAAAGFSVERLVTMAAPVTVLGDGPVPDSVGEVTLDELRPLFDAGWSDRMPSINDTQLEQLTDRYRLEAAVVDVRCLAARDGDDVVAGCLVKLDGGTAWLDGLETAPTHRRRGHASGLVRAAARLAAETGSDLLGLDTVADDWPRDWYRRIGFSEVATTLHSVRV